MTDDHAAPALDGLTRELEALRRRLDELAALPRRVDELAHLFAGLADSPRDRSDTDTAERSVPSLLNQPTGSDPDDTGSLLDRLAAWVSAVYLRYFDARHLPDCWLWHPEVVEELLWLHAAWLTAHAPDGPPAAAPTADAAAVIASWWAACREQQPPPPSAEQLDAARLRYQRGARR